MNDLNALLERAAGPVTAPVDAHADLTRARRALSRTRRRRSALGLAGVATAGVVGVAAVRLTDRSDVVADRSGTHHQKQQQNLGVPLLAQPFTAGPYTFDQTPEGWEVQGAYPTAVTIAPVGFPDQEPLSFAGKLVIMLDTNPIGAGDRVDADGRTFVVAADDDYTLVSTRTRPGEPDGVLRIQYPTSTGWSRATMIAFLAGVQVGPGAQPGVG
jgi:hypothetical protein